MPNEETELTHDAFLGGALMALQPRKGYRAGIDAVLLAASVPDMGGALLRVLDAGAGVGVVGLCVARRIASARVVMVERDTELAELAAKNVAKNMLGSRVSVAVADVSTGGSALAQAVPEGLQPASFDHVLANPPYFADGRGTASPDRLKSGSHAMAVADLDGWVRFLAAACKADGFATVIHRVEALGELLAAMGPRFGGLTVLPMQPREGEPASRIIVRGRKGSRGPLVLRPALVLHGEGQSYRPDVEAVLRHGAALLV